MRCEGRGARAALLRAIFEAPPAVRLPAHPLLCAPSRGRYARLSELALFDALVYQELRERDEARLTVGERGLLGELLAYAADGALNFADMHRLLRDAQDGAVAIVVDCS